MSQHEDDEQKKGGSGPTEGAAGSKRTGERVEVQIGEGKPVRSEVEGAEEEEVHVTVPTLKVSKISLKVGGVRIAIHDAAAERSED